MLTEDQIAAMNLYTKQNSEHPGHSFFKLLNQALNGRERDQVSSFLPYLRLVADVPKLLPNAGPCDVLRVFPTQQAGWDELYQPGKRVHWWGFTSTTRNSNGNILMDPMFFGTSGQRMLFMLHITNGMDIREFSDFPQEDEVLLIDNANKPGALAELARALGKAGVNIEYLYCATAPKSRKGLLVLRVDDAPKALDTLKALPLD